MAERKKDTLTIGEVRSYWGKKNIPQQWYSKKEPFTLAWFNELSFKRYSRYYPHIKQWAEFEYHPGEEVLEIGVGIGTDLVEYAKGGAVVSGVDLGKDQVMLTKLNLDLHKLPYKEIKEGNIENLPFPDNSFDVVLCIGVVHHTPDSQKAIDEIYRVLKPDGQAMILVYARGWKHYIKRCLIHGLLLGKWMKYGFDWKKVYSEVSEVHGSAPKTDIYTRCQVKKMFAKFGDVEIRKKRLGEFFEYKPYNTVKFPDFVKNIFFLFNLEGLLGENWMIRALKRPFPKEAKLWEVWFKHY